MPLKLQAYSAGRWTASSAVVVTGLQLGQTLVLARVLMPSEFGLMAIAGALLAVIGLFSDMGFSRALIHYDDVSRDSLSSLYWLNLGIACGLMLLLLVAAPFVATLYDAPVLKGVLQVTSLIFPLTAAGQQFRTLAEKELRFAELAFNEVAATGLAVVFAFAVAFAGGGVYALVVGVLVRSATSSVLAWHRLSGANRPTWRLQFADVSPYLRFGGYMVGESVANTLRRQADVFVGGLFASPSSLGLFAVPRDLSFRLSAVINPILTRVGFPIMSRVKNDSSKLRSIYLQTLHMTASVNFPLYMGLALFSDEVVALLYGSQWQGAGRYLRIMALWGLLRSIGNPVGSLIYASGRARLGFFWNSSLLVIVPPLLWLGAHAGGLAGLAWTLLILQGAIIIPAWRLLVYPLCGAGIRDYAGAFVAPLLLSVLATLPAYFVASMVDGNTTRVALGFATGAATYLALSLWLNREWTDTMRELFKIPARRT